jgi:hypothetical protein
VKREVFMRLKDLQRGAWDLWFQVIKRLFYVFKNVLSVSERL